VAANDLAPNTTEAAPKAAQKLRRLIPVFIVPIALKYRLLLSGMSHPRHYFECQPISP
jgi:hypothetical protein